jgi:DNA modification methylase
MKPVELIVEALSNSSKQEDIVMDLFLGSGSTLIASEKIGRICYGMELDPKYIDVIVQRYVDYVDSPIVKLNGKIIEWKKTEKTIK